jgi:hypothetical protein
MKCCDLIGPMGRLKKSTARLKEAWLEAKEHWNDKASQEFEKNFLQPLPSQITLMVAAIHKLDDVFKAAEKDLEDQREI